VAREDYDQRGQGIEFKRLKKEKSPRHESLVDKGSGKEGRPWGKEGRKWVGNKKGHLKKRKKENAAGGWLGRPGDAKGR